MAAMLDLDPTTMMLGLVFSGIGFVAFRYGRKMDLLPPVVIGLALMIVPVFASAVWLTVIGVLLTFALWLFRE